MFQQTAPKLQLPPVVPLVIPAVTVIEALASYAATGRFLDRDHDDE